MHLISSLLLQHSPIVEHIHAGESCPPVCHGVGEGLRLSYSELLEEFEHAIQSETGHDHLSGSDGLHALAGIMGVQSRLIRGNNSRRSSLTELVTVQRSTNKGLAAPGLPEQRARMDPSLLVPALSSDQWLLFVRTNTSQACS